MTRMKVATAVFLFAALGIIVGVLTGFVFPIVDVDCGTNPSHLVLNIGKAGGASANDVSINQPGTSSNESTAKQTSDRCDHHREGSHVHGAAHRGCGG